MKQSAYIAAVNAVLAGQTEQAVRQLRQALDALPAETRQVTIDIHVDQGNEGFLGVRVGVDGPDLYVLNKAMQPHAQILQTVMQDGKLSPPLPLMGGNAFVGDALTDCATHWLREVWKLAAHPANQLPVQITSPRGYGSLLPLKLQ